MSMFIKNRKLILGLIIGLMLVVGANYIRLYLKNHSEEALKQRANVYWEAIRLNDLQTAYKLEAETAAGNLLPHDVEVNPEWGLKVVQFNLGNVVIVGDVGEIDVTTMLTMMEFGGKTFPGGTKKDLWSFVDGQWFHGTPQVGGAGIRKRPDPYRQGIGDVKVDN